MKKTLSRRAIQIGVAILILILSLLHIYGNKAVWAPLDAYCPFGGLETIWKLAIDGGYLEKIQPSNLSLGLALIIITLLFGAIFCGWICPLGTLQDVLNKLGRMLKLPQIKISSRLDRYLRGLRYFVLGIVLLESFKLAQLWFANYDPFRIIFGLHWIAEPNKISVWGWIIFGLFIILSLLINRFWCKYLCPLGILIQWISKISWFKLKWRRESCTGCNLCNKKCPLAINVQQEKLNSTDCNNCLECIAVCPKPAVLQYKAPFADKQQLAIVGVIVFAIILGGAQWLGWWSPKIGSDPESIKGWMTLGYISEKFHIPLDELKEGLKMPDSVNTATELRSLEEKIPGFEMDKLRVFVAGRIGKQLVTTDHNEKMGKQADVAKQVSGQAQKIETRTEDTSSGNGLIMSKGAKTDAHHGSINYTNPDDIKGRMSLKEVGDGWNVPLEQLIEKLQLPKDIDVNLPIRELQIIEASNVRTAVAEILESVK